MAPTHQLRTWAADNRAWAAESSDPVRAASLRRRADELDELARLKDAEDPPGRSPAQPQDDVIIVIAHLGSATARQGSVELAVIGLQDQG